MMEQHSGVQEPLFFCFSLENPIPKDPLLRGVNRSLDLRDFRQHLADYSSPIGRPSIDPELMIRMLIVGYALGFAPERRLWAEATRIMIDRVEERFTLKPERLVGDTDGRVAAE